ncbi:class I SAM-dependent methyltransferase [Nocardioides sp. KIGAM211]|uniref:Class I SAM-dependent methyltransferase n=1 Tax=Nocardioides luti TaxID=2761101 RepID=A0A7X0RCI2_9ACTN|nr:class I SAM-dependent methyltransferase [Nocardioides luti]MBB6625807.1 class I SAM-dependent methyltransferase [Nocardioides luti]
MSRAYDEDPVDPHFGVPRLAAVYDALDPDRSDLDAYVALVDGLGATSVLDVGCGTGVLACLLAGRGLDVTGVDPAGASLDVARARPGAERVTWCHGDATALPPLQVDVAVMTANVAQVFLTDEAWATTLAAVHAALRPGGHVVLETRVPEAEAWRGWTPERTHRRVEVAGVGAVVTRTEVTDVALPLVSFAHTIHFEADGATYHSPSTLRFRTATEIGDSLVAAGFEPPELREAPDRPGLEIVALARRR